MNIAFYGNHPHWGGLANNGGSRTILLSAEVLRGLGHGVKIVTHTDRFTWFPHPPVVKKVPKDTDVLIAISISDIKEIQKYHGMKLAYWARPFETWQMDEEKIIRKLKKFSGIIMCNSGWQVDFLLEHGIESHLIFSGQDLSYRDRAPDYTGEFKLSIGCQYSTKPRKNWKAFKKLAGILGSDYEYVAFGSEKCKDKFVDTYLRNPSREKLNDLYRGMDIFYCPNTTEGFYNPGIEASIQGSLIVSHTEWRNGCGDYCSPPTAHVCRSMPEVVDAIKNPDFTKVVRMQKLIREKIGTREENMKKMVEIIVQ